MAASLTLSSSPRVMQIRRRDAQWKYKREKEKYKVHSKRSHFLLALVTSRRDRETIRRIHRIPRGLSPANARWNYSPPRFRSTVASSTLKTVTPLSVPLLFPGIYVWVRARVFLSTGRIARWNERSPSRLQKAAALNLERKAILGSTSFKEEFSSYWRIFSRV